VIIIREARALQLEHQPIRTIGGVPGRKVFKVSQTSPPLCENVSRDSRNKKQREKKQHRLREKEGSTLGLTCHLWAGGVISSKERKGGPLLKPRLRLRVGGYPGGKGEVGLKEQAFSSTRSSQGVHGKKTWITLSLFSSEEEIYLMGTRGKGAKERPKEDQAENLLRVLISPRHLILGGFLPLEKKRKGLSGL